MARSGNKNATEGRECAPDQPSEQGTAAPTRSELRRMNKRTKIDAKEAKTEAKALKREEKARKKEAKAFEKGDYGRVSPSSTKRVIGIAKVVGPVVAPYVVQGAAAAREGVDRMRARRLGVPVDDLGRYTGRGAGLHARIAGDADALHEVRARAAGRTDEESLAADQFAEAAEKQLTQLLSAVRAAERMPVGRRRAAHRAVAGELNRIEDDLFRRLGV